MRILAVKGLNLEGLTLFLILLLTMFPFDPPENITKSLVFWCYRGIKRKPWEGKGNANFNTWQISVAWDGFIPCLFDSSLFPDKKKYFCETIDLNIIFRRSHPFNISKGNFVGNMLLLCSDGYLTQKEFWCIPDAVIQSCSRKRFSLNLAIHIEKHQRWSPFLPLFQSSYPTEQLSQEKFSYP